MMHGMQPKRAVWIVAVSATLLVLIWQAATVYGNYGGNWSGLFCIGNRWAQPPDLSAEKNLIFEHPGYDGGFYHLVAHDPWMKRGFSKYVDNPNLRWRRILIPMMAFLAAAGDDQRIHAGYIGVHLLFIFAGVFWLSGYCVHCGLHPAWGFGFIAIPSVLVSIDRLTIDTALAALAVGFIYYAGKDSHIHSLVLLALCPLARESGLFLTVGRAWEQTIRREWRRLTLTILSTLPFLLWVCLVLSKSTRDGTQWLSFPFAGIIRRTFNPLVYAISGRWVAVAAILDYLALIGIWIALAFVVRLALKRRSGLIENSAYVFALGAVLLGKADIWGGAYEFGRTMSPLLIMLGLLAIRDRNRWALMPLACVLPRILLQYDPQIRGILRHWIF
jgi:hypothetical protein